MSTAPIANFNGQKPMIDVNDTAMLLIDHQSGLFQVVQDMPMTTLRANVTTLAKVATLAKIPVVTSASVPQGPNGPLIPEVHEFAPHAKYVARKGEINVWDSPEFVAAVKETGRNTLVIAATITSVCMAFPSISAVHDGRQGVRGDRCLRHVLEDGTGDYPGASFRRASCRSTLRRLLRDPADWNRPDAERWAEAYSAVFPPTSC